MTDSWSRLASNAVITGSAASIAAAAAVVILAKLEGKAAPQPINATSHWLHGDEAADVAVVDTAHTASGFATHHASGVFWAAPFEVWLSFQPPRSWSELLGRAGIMSAVAAVVDYTATPKRFTPGWELVVSKTSMFATYCAFALGLASGAYMANRDRWRFN